MSRIARFSLLFCLGLCLDTVLAGDDEVHLKPKNYAPSKSLGDQSYSAHAYVPATASQPLGTTLKPTEKSRWSFFTSKTQPLADKKISNAPEEKGVAYKQQHQISVPTLPPDPSSVPEKKPFDANGKKVTDANYQAPKPSNEKDPMLKPRQGIKEPE
jgi:hypothetical protein